MQHGNHQIEYHSESEHKIVLHDAHSHGAFISQTNRHYLIQRRWEYVLPSLAKPAFPATMENIKMERKHLSEQ